MGTGGWWVVPAWGLSTELLRPLVGQEWFQFVQRDGDYVPPVAFVIGAGPGSTGSGSVVTSDTRTHQVLARR